MTSRILRRSRLRSAGEQATSKIDTLMQSIATLEADIATLTDALASAKDELEKAMLAGQVSEHECAGLVAHFVDVYSSVKREAPVETVFKMMPLEEFFQVVKVQLGALNQFMSEREIGKIVVVEEAKKTGTKFEVVRPKKKVGR